MTTDFRSLKKYALVQYSIQRREKLLCARPLSRKSWLPVISDFKSNATLLHPFSDTYAEYQDIFRDFLEKYQKLSFSVIIKDHLLLQKQCNGYEDEINKYDKFVKKKEKKIGRAGNRTRDLSITSPVTFVCWS